MTEVHSLLNPEVLPIGCNIISMRIMVGEEFPIINVESRLLLIREQIYKDAVGNTIFYNLEHLISIPEDG